MFTEILKSRCNIWIHLLHLEKKKTTLSVMTMRMLQCQSTDKDHSPCWSFNILISHTKCPHAVSNAITTWLTNNAHHPLDVYSSCYRFRKFCNLLSCNFNLSAFTFYITQMHNQPVDLPAATTSSSLRLIAYIDICTYSVAVCSILNKCPYDTWVT